jgi:hypothetical protein
LGHEVVAPGRDVLARDVVDQALEAPLALVDVHVQGPGQGVGDLFGAVGVDDQRLLHLPRGAGEARQDQHARILRRLRGHVLLGHQVHAVAQRRDQGRPGRAIDPRQLVAAIAAIEVADRVVVHVGIGAVDPADQAVQPPAQVLVGLDLVARDRGDLQQHDLAARLGIVVQEALEADQPLLQPLGIVQAIDADDHLAEHAVGHQPVVDADGARAFLDAGEVLGVDADREGRGLGDLAEGGQPTVLGPLAPHLVEHVAFEGLDAFLGLEAHQVVMEQRVHQGTVTRQGHDQLVGRPGDVQEEADAVGDAQPPQLPRHRDQVIVVHPDDVVRLDQRQQGLGEPLVDPVVALAERAVIGGQVDAIVEQRPQGLVGVAVVIFLVVALLQVDRGHGDAVGLVHVQLTGELGGGLAAPAEPDAGIFPQGGGQGHGQAADALLALAGGRIDAIGNDDQTAHAAALPIEALSQSSTALKSFRR